MIDPGTIRYGKASTGEVAVVLADVAAGLRKMSDAQPNAHLRGTMRWAADFLKAVDSLMQERFG